MYWPKETSETYGIIQVKLVREDIMATYTVRTLLIKHLKVINTRIFFHCSIKQLTNIYCFSYKISVI